MEDLRPAPDFTQDVPYSAVDWRIEANTHERAGDKIAAAKAWARSITASCADAALREAEEALRDGNLSHASVILERQLAAMPDDLVAVRLRGDLAMRTGRFDEAERDFRHCLGRLPTYVPARVGLAAALFRLARFDAALEQIDAALELSPTEPDARGLKAMIAGTCGNHEEARALQSGLAVERGSDPQVWLALAHTCRIMGRTDESVAACRRTLEADPECGEAYWSLANLKSVGISSSHIASMFNLFRQSRLSARSRLHIHFALGKAFEDEGDFASAFEHYRQGNAMMRRAVRYDYRDQQAMHELLSTGFAEQAPVRGHPDPAPIFIVGLPRSGSTLVEQILASHPAVEGTMELPYIEIIAHRLMTHSRFGLDTLLAERLVALSGDECRKLGEEYLQRAQIHRKLGRRHFIDKQPGNFAHVGLIRTILPNARIIDVRREPLAACLSIYKQLFAHGNEFSYDLADTARHYRSYTDTMTRLKLIGGTHLHHLQYEALVGRPDHEIPKLLAFLELDMHEACLRPHENARAVATPSSEQVRQPISRTGIDHWRNFESWLGAAKAILTEV